LRERSESKFNTKVAGMWCRSDSSAAKGDRGIEDFSTLLRSTNEEVFSFGRVDSETVQGEPRIDSNKSGRKSGKVGGRIRAGERYIELGVISIEVEGDRRISKSISDRAGIEGKMKWAKDRALRDASIEWDGMRGMILDGHKLRAVGQKRRK
jgi:hypothetical protein